MTIDGYEELKLHLGHKIVCMHYKNIDDNGTDETTIECETCHEILYSEISKEIEDINVEEIECAVCSEKFTCDSCDEFYAREPECNDDYSHEYKNPEVDSRQEWTETVDVCIKCGLVRTNRTEYSQNGLVSSDKYFYEMNKNE